MAHPNMVSAFPGYLRVLTGKARNFYKEDL